MGVASAWFAYGRFADPARMLAMAGPDKRLTFARAMWRYGRGEVRARMGDAAGVRAEAARLSPDQVGRLPNTTTANLTEIAQLTLLGRAAMIEGNYREAADRFRAAARLQEDSFANDRDPPTWWYPARRSLAAALLAQGKYGEALEETQTVLKRWPKDPMTLLVVSRAQAGLGDRTAVTAAISQAHQGWGYGEIGRTPLGLI
jgi:tetratricopeptide (TPR) repeat protein